MTKNSTRRCSICLKGFKGYGDKVGTKTATDSLRKAKESLDIVHVNSLKKSLMYLSIKLTLQNNFATRF